MVREKQESRYEALVENLRQIEEATLAFLSTEEERGTSPLVLEDREAMAEEINRLRKQIDHLRHEIKPSQLQNFEDGIALLCVAQSRGINTCWHIADRINRAYGGKGYFTMQSHLTEQDRRANQRVIAGITAMTDKMLIETAFAIAETLNGLGGPDRHWNCDWLTNAQRIDLIEKCFQILKKIVLGNDFELKATSKSEPKNAPMAASAIVF